jgi:hypothetical protein
MDQVGFGWLVRAHHRELSKKRQANFSAAAHYFQAARNSRIAMISPH